MKKIITLALTLSAIFVNAQDASKVFSSTEMTFFGVDFTKAKFVAEKETGSELKYEVLPGINTLMVSEQAKNYNLKMAFQKDVVYYDPTAVNALNSKVDADKLTSFNPTKVERADLDAMVKNYTSSEKKEGLGLALIVENFNKAEKMGTVWVTFFDIATKKILLAEKMSGKPMGITVTNFWAGVIKSVLKQLQEGTYSSWKK
jgi:hypothetical protein